MLIYNVVYDVNKTLAVLHHAATSHDNEIEAIPPGNCGGKDNQIEAIPTGNSGGNGNGIQAIPPLTAGEMATESSHSTRKPRGK